MTDEYKNWNDVLAGEITTPGAYCAMSAVDYHADPCPEPSLSSSIARVLLNRSPLHAWIKHPKLNQAYEDNGGSRAMDLGSAVHEMLLGRGSEIVEIEAVNFTTKAAREARDAARAIGKTPLLTDDCRRAEAMSNVARARLAGHPAYADDGFSETVIAWKEGRVWCRAMIDRMSLDRRSVLDIKTTAKTARPEAATRTIFDMGYHFQMAFYERGLNVLFPGDAGRRTFTFLFQEDEAPYECSLIKLDEGAMTIARKQVMAAIGIWKRCMASNHWPGYPRSVQTASMPEWMQQQWLTRELSDDALTGDDGQPSQHESNKEVMWTP